MTDPSVIRDVEIYLSNLGPSGTVAYEKMTNALNLNDVTQPIDANTENNEIAENAPIGTEVGIDVLANDDDASDNVTYSLTSDAGGAISIDTVSGSIFKSGFLDFETASQHEIKVLATSTDGSQAEASFVIDVIDVEDSNSGPNIDGNGQTGRSNDKVIYFDYDDSDPAQVPDLSKVRFLDW